MAQADISSAINLNNFDTILLDMDGTLLDLNFDLYFWMEFLPKQYAKKHNIDEKKAITVVHKTLNNMQGKLEWYCVDYWSDVFAIPITALKKEVSYLIAVHPFVIDFLKRINKQNKKIFLVTNAHRDVIDLKMELTNLTPYFDKVISSHNYGFAKENPKFWQVFYKDYPFNKYKTIFFDDSKSVLKAAQNFGIKSIAISKPSSQQKAKKIEGFLNIVDFSGI